jgi:hypothetical protein
LSPEAKKIPIGLARVRKELPPPSKVFKSRHQDSRKRAKEKLQREIDETLPRHSQ